jgi:hypothetical protein
VTRLPTQHEHFDEVIATDAVPALVSFLEFEIRLKITGRDLDVREP